MASRTFATSCAFGLLLTAQAFAGEVTSVPWKATDIWGKRKDTTSEDVSGIACATTSSFPRTCIIIDDNSQSAQVVTLREGSVDGTSHSLIKLLDNEIKVKLEDGSSDTKKLELDGEGVAFDGKETFYVIGSHGYPRDSKNKLDPIRDRDLIAARIAAASQIVKLKLDPSGTFTVDGKLLSLPKAIEGDAKLAPYANRRLDQDGLTIEGIAILGGNLLSGFRGPVLAGDCAAILSVPLDSLEHDAQPKGELVKFHFGKGIGIRDLAVDGDRVLILTGPQDDVDGAYSIYSWNGGRPAGYYKLASLSNVAGAGDDHKAEALLPIDLDAAGERVLVMFDGRPNGSPILITVPKEDLSQPDLANSCTH